MRHDETPLTMRRNWPAVIVSLLMMWMGLEIMGITDNLLSVWPITGLMVLTMGLCGTLTFLFGAGAGEERDRYLEYVPKDLEKTKRIRELARNATEMKIVRSADIARKNHDLISQIKGRKLTLEEKQAKQEASWWETNYPELFYGDRKQ